jgi:hypothetical protein
MSEILELLPNQSEVAGELFETEQEYAEFRDAFMREVIPQQEEWLKARRKSEEEARQKLLR